MDSNKIALKINGNPSANAGYASIGMHNSPLFQLPDGAAAVGNVPFYFTIFIEPRFTQYTIVHNNVKSFGAQRDGALKIAISVPAGYKLSNNISPYDVLMQVDQRFRAAFLKEGFQPGTFQYAKENITSDELQRVIYPVIDQYSTMLVNVGASHRPMKQGGPVAFVMCDAVRTKELFRDVQYPEFASYGEIVVAEAVAPTPALVKLQIPRPVNYEVWLNGVRKQVVADPNQPVEFGIHSIAANPAYYTVAPVRFTVSQLLQGATFPGVRLDRGKERIEVTLDKKPVKKEVRVDIDGAGSLEPMLLAKLVVYVKGVQKSLAANNILYLLGEELGEKTVTLSLDDKDYKLKSSTVSLTGDNLRVTVVPRSGIRTVGGGGISGFGGNTPFEGKNGGVTDALPLTVKLPKELMKSDRPVSLAVLRDGSDSSWKCSLPARSYRDGITVYVPKSISGLVTVEASDGKKSVSKSCNLSSAKELDMSREKISGVKSSWLVPLVASVVGAILFFALGAWLGPKITFGKDKDDKDKVENTNGIGEEPLDEAESDSEEDSFENLKPEQVRSMVDGYSTTLANPDVTFAQIDEMYSQMQKIKEKAPDLLPLETEQKITLYQTVVNKIKEGDLQGATDAIERQKSLFNDIHLNYLRAAYKGWTDATGYHQYQAESAGMAKAQFVDRHADFTSFRDIESLKEGKREDVTAKKSPGKPKVNGNNNNNSSSRTGRNPGGGRTGGGTPGPGGEH